MLLVKIANSKHLREVFNLDKEEVEEEGDYVTYVRPSEREITANVIWLIISVRCCNYLLLTHR